MSKNDLATRITDEQERNSSILLANNPLGVGRYSFMIRNALFDFDYTLADSSRGVHECINHALTTLELAPVEYEAACKTVGLSLKETFRVLAGKRPQVECDEFVRLFISRADELMVDMINLFDTVEPTTARLISAGFRLGIVSTKYRRRIEPVLSRERLDGRFNVIVGGEDVREHKPDPEGLLQALEKLGTVPTDSVYVGDSVTDAIVAERAGVAFVAVLTGVTPREAFAEYNTVDILESVELLPELLEHI